MRLTSQIKELGAILQKLIKFEPGLNPDRKMRQIEMDWCCWRCGCPRTWGLRGWARCNNGNDSETKCSHKNWK